MSVSYTGGLLAVSGGDQPVIAPDAICEGCGARGTVGVAARGDAARAEIEEHRFCADCWAEWSAFYRARWHDQARRARLAWRDRSAETRDTAPSPASGMWFESATWHGVIDYVQSLTLQARNYRDPPSPETLARVDTDIRARAVEKVGPMPLEVRTFIAQFAREDPSAPAS